MRGRGGGKRESFEGEFRGRVSREGEGGESLLMMLYRGSTSSFCGLSPLFRSL